MDFKNKFTNSLKAEDPIDSSDYKTGKSRHVNNCHFSFVNPEPVSNPKLIISNEELASELQVDFTGENRDYTIGILSGNINPEENKAYALRYGGYQFGVWAGQLGDGRAITLGELEKDTKKSLEVQLKGAGKTPYSRSGDGRAVFRSSIREFLCSEAMHHLGIATTRSLCCISTGDRVLREISFTMAIQNLNQGLSQFDLLNHSCVSVAMRYYGVQMKLITRSISWILQFQTTIQV